MKRRTRNGASEHSNRRDVGLGIAWIAIASVAVASSCGGAPSPGSPIACSDGERLALDCSSEVAYQGVKTNGGLEILSIGSAKAAYEDQAIRQVNDQLGQFVAVQTRLCREYNSCVTSAAEYKEAAERTREIFQTAAAVGKQPEGEDRAHAFDKLYAQVVPDTASPEQLTLELRLDAKLPESVGGGQRLVRPGGPLPTNARVAFSFVPSKDAYVYVYQTTPSGDVNVLFPNPKIQGVENPVRAKASTRIPAGDQWIRVNESDLGTEKVFILASVEPVPAVGKSLAAASAGAVKVGDDPLLARVGANDGAPCQRGLEVEACPGSRGLELPGGETSSMVARTRPGDGAIVRVFTFEHLSEEAFAKLPKDDTPGGRGIVIHD